MKSALDNKYALFVIDFLVVLFCIAGLYQIYFKATLPFNLKTIDDHLTLTNFEEVTPGIKDGNILLSVDNYEFNNWEEVELYLDGKRIGDKVRILVYQNGNEKLFTATLTNYYSTFDLLIIGIVGLFFIVFAILVRLKAPDNISAKLFHLASIGLGMVIIMTAGNYTIAPFGLGYLNRILWLIAYSFTPVLFIHFTISFIKSQDKKLRRMLQILYSISVINVIILTYFFFDATLGSDTQSIRDYVLFYDSFFRLFVLSCVVIAISICIFAFRRATDLEERKRLQWLLLGFFIGPFSFILFWILPILLTGYSLIPEALILIFLTAIPITFSIAIVKYHLMDIHLLVRRSLVYSVILALIIITYIGLSSLITLFVQNVNPAFPTIITAIAVVALLQPVKNVIQKFVDKKFFRVEYDYREEQKRFLEDIKNSLDIRTLAEELVIHTDALIPLDSIGFFILRQSDSRIKLIANKGWDLLEGRSIRFESENLKTDLSLPIAMDDRVEPGLNIESADLKVFKRWGIVLVFPVKSPTGDVHAFLALGAKKSGTRYLKDDVDLLNTVVAAAALAVDRITLQEELILEHLEAERLKELDEMRTEFINTMTHELKTPLTNIKLFTQLTVLNIESTSPKAKENLRIIDGESDKLQGLIENILDYAKIEKGMMMYEIKKIEITEILKKSVDSVLYQFSIKKQTLENNISDQQAYIYADAAAVDRAIINLLTNASKYSSINSKTIISTELNEDYFIISIKDSGRGIPSEELNNVFKPFIRVNEKTANKTKGTGLGLAIVKHIMDAHNGKIDVQSEVGKGSIFTLWFPVIKDV